MRSTLHEDSPPLSTMTAARLAEIERVRESNELRSDERGRLAGMIGELLTEIQRLQEVALNIEHQRFIRILELETALHEASSALGVEGPGALRYRLDVAARLLPVLRQA